jgi:glutamate transport system permease protein
MKLPTQRRTAGGPTKLATRRRTAPAGSLLYDAPGPRTRLITYLVSAVSTVAIAAGVYFLIYLPLQEKGQFTLAKWGPLVDPENKNFDALWKRIGEGMQNTLTAAALAIVFSLLIGTTLAVVRVQLQQLRRRNYTNVSPGLAWTLRQLTWLLNAITRFCVEVFRGLPVVITIFFVARGLPEFGFDFDNLWFIVIGLTIYNGVVIGEILRSGMTGLPGGQAEAANSIGLSPMQTTRLVLLPQAYRIMLPALISQVVVVLKDTSLGFLIGYDDVLQVAKQAINLLKNPIQLYFVVGAIFIVVNYALSKLAQYLQRRLAQGRRTPATAAVLADTTAAGVTGTAT